MSEENKTITHFVHYQLCPKCNGQGIVSIPPWVPGDLPSWSSTTVENYVCNVCNGSKIIPLPINPPNNN